jgi:nitrous oxidase accessory protein
MRIMIVFLIIVLTCEGILSAKTIPVGKEEQFKSIAPAILQAEDGDTIRVAQGLYHEHNLLIDKSITLIGLNHPVLDGENTYENVSIKANNVTLDGFKICNSGIASLTDYAGVKIYHVRNVTVIHNILDNCFFGIYSLYSTSCLIKENQLTAVQMEEQRSGNGIHCWKSDSMQIIGNTISGHRDGIYFEFVTNSIIWRNNSHNNIRYGLHFMFSQNDTYAVNIFENNGAGVSVMFSKQVKMFHNYFRENWGDGSYGILLKEISDSYIDGNIFENNTSGIFIEGGSRIEMYKNTFKNNGWALKIEASCMDIVVKNNNFQGNTFDVGTNGSLVLNNFDYNYWDKYEGYDLNRDKIGDIPYRPVSMFSMLVEKNPPAMILFRSLITALMDKSEKIIPSLTPENLKDNHPYMNPVQL